MMKTGFMKLLTSAIILLFIGIAYAPSIITSEPTSNQTVYYDETGSLSGFVKDASMNPIEGAVIRAVCGENYFENVSDSSGYYYIDNMPLIFCLWNVSASKAGYKTIWVEMSIGENTTYDFVLMPFGKTLYVGGSGDGNYTAIQSAIDDANNGDTVFVYSGTYYENVVVNKTIALTGEDRVTTVIDGDKNDEALYVSADNCIIRRFTMQNGYYNTVSIGSSNNILTENIITHAVDYGISIDKPSRNNTISYNLLSNNGYCSIKLASSGNIISKNILRGINIISSGNFIIDNTFFNRGISIYYLSIAPPSYPNIVINNTINGKRLVYWDGESNKLIENDAGQIILMKCNNITVENLEISNVSTGILLFKTNDCHIRNNSISSVGCGIRLYDSSNNNTILDNNISFNGGIGILLGNCSNSIISSNVISNNWDGIYMEKPSPKPNVIYLNKNTIISGNVISSNRRFNIFFTSSLNTYVYRNNITYAGNNAFPSLSIYSSFFTKIEQNNFIDNAIDARFTKAYFCHWKGNYWDEPRFLPYPIYGRISDRPPYYIPWINLDWHPAKEPYDIPILEVS